MLLYNLGKKLFRSLFFLMKWQVHGQQKMPQQGPVIMVINHVSNWDPVVAACAVDRPVHYMGKEELFNNKFIGGLLKTLGAFPVKRGHGDMSAIRQALRILKEGKVLGIFPEGTRSKNGKLQKALPGMILLMEKSNAPIVPVRVFGTKQLLTKGWGKLAVVIGDPIAPQDFAIPEGIDDRREWMAQEIMKAIERLAPPGAKSS